MQLNGKEYILVKLNDISPNLKSSLITLNQQYYIQKSKILNAAKSGVKPKSRVGAKRKKKQKGLSFYWKYVIAVILIILGVWFVLYLKYCTFNNVKHTILKIKKTENEITTLPTGIPTSYLLFPT